MSALLKFILVAIAVVIIFYVFMKILKSVLKAVTFLALIFFLIIAILGGIIYLDYKDVKENFFEQDSLLAVVEEDDVLTVVEVSPKVNLNKTPVSSFKNETIVELIENKSFNIDSHYKTIIVNDVVFEKGLPEKMEAFGAVNISKTEFMDVLSAEEPEDMIDLSRIEFRNNTSEDVKTVMVALGAREIVKNKGSGYILDEYKNENIMMYPETLSMKILKLISSKDKIPGNFTVG